MVVAAVVAVDGIAEPNIEGERNRSGTYRWDVVSMSEKGSCTGSMYRE